MGDRSLSLLAELSKHVAAAPDLAAALHSVTDRALRLVGADHTSVRLCDAGRDLLPGARAGVGLHRPPPAFRLGEGVIGWVAQSGELARVDDGTADPRFRPMPARGFPVRSVLSVPMCGDRGVVGVLSMSAPRPAAFGPREESVGVLLASAAAQAVRIGALSRLAITDEHTGAYNRRYLGPRLTEEIGRSQRSGEPLSVLLLDLDHFKRVNDQYGHATGDEALRQVSAQIRSCVRSVDVLIRRGGEEFVVILPGTAAEAAFEVAERIRTTVMREPLEVAPRMWLVQTLSVGVATWDGSEGAEELDRRADLAMYSAKREGRNRVAASRASKGEATPRS